MAKCYALILMMIGLLAGSANCFAAGQDFTDQNGNAVKLEDYKGKWVLFAFLSPNCHFCKKQTPILNQLVATYADKVVVLGVDHAQQSQAQLQSFHSGWNMKFPIIQQDPTQFLNIPPVTAAPTMVLIDPNGKQLPSLVGAYSLLELEDMMFKKR